MAYKQPRVPQMQGGDAAGYMKRIALFLRDYCMEAWNADRRKDEELARMARRLDVLEGKGETTDGDTHP